MNNSRKKYDETVKYIRNLSINRDIFLFIIATLMVAFVVSNIGKGIDEFLGFKVSNFIEMYSIILIYPLYLKLKHLNAEYFYIKSIPEKNNKD